MKISNLKKQKEFKDLIQESDFIKLEWNAHQLFLHLDTISDHIRILEKKLSELKAHFPFRKIIFKEDSSVLKNLEERHKDYSFPGIILGYFTQIYWYLAWEQDENSNNFRLLLISEEKEFINFCEEEVYVNNEINSKILSKKPIIETDLATRVKFGQYLKNFLDTFTEHLSFQRMQISTW